MSILKTGVITGNMFNEGYTNFTRVGTPTISDSGILSGMAVGTNYIKTNIDFTNMSNFKVNCAFTPVDVATGRHNTIFHLWDGGSVDSLQLWQSNGNKTSITLVYPTSDSTTASYSATSVALNEYHTASIEYNGTTLSYYVDNTLKTSVDININYLKKSYILTIGTCSRDGNAKYFAGTIDLTKFAIWMNGKVVYTPAQNKASISTYQVTASDFYEV